MIYGLTRIHGLGAAKERMHYIAFIVYPGTGDTAKYTIDSISGNKRSTCYNSEDKPSG